MVSHSTTELQRYLFWILVMLRPYLEYWAGLTSIVYVRGEEMIVDNITAGIANLRFCSGSGEASGPTCQPMRFKQLCATA